MNAQRILTVVLVVLCVSAVGLSATSLDSALETHPDDVVELDYDRLPIGKGDAARIEDEVESNQGQNGGGSASSNDGDPGTGSGDGSESRETRPDTDDSTESRSDASSGGTSDGGGESDSGLGGSGSGVGVTGLGVSLLGRLLSLLPWVLVLLGLALAYRYRERLASVVLALVAPLFVPASDTGSPEERWRGVPPSNDVHRAWLAMVDSTPIDRPWTKTPVECAHAARESGIDPATVETVTRAFEEVRYGGRPVTAERRRAVREAMEHVRGGAL